MSEVPEGAHEFARSGFMARNHHRLGGVVPRAMESLPTLRGAGFGGYGSRMVELREGVFHLPRPAHSAPWQQALHT